MYPLLIMKQCKKCLIEKEENCYRIYKSRWKEYTQKTCKECERLAQRWRCLEYYYENKEACLKRMKDYCINNPEKVKERTKTYYAKNTWKIKEYQKKYYQTEIWKQKIKEAQKRYHQTENWKQKLKEAYNRYIKWTPEWNFIDRCKNRWKMAKKRYNLDASFYKRDIKAKHLRELMEKQNYICPETWMSLFLFCPNTDQWIPTYHVDHIISFSNWWFHGIDNIQLLSPYWNLRKW